MAIVRTAHRYRDVHTGKIIDIWFPASGAVKKRSCLAGKVGLISGDVVDIAIESIVTPPVYTEDAHLRSHRLSDRTVKPNEIDLEAIFGRLPNVA